MNVGDRVVVWPAYDSSADEWVPEAKKCVGKTYIVRRKVAGGVTLSNVHGILFHYKNLIVVNDSCIFVN